MEYKINESVDSATNQALLKKEVRDFTLKLEEKILEQINVDSLIKKFSNKAQLKVRLNTITELLESYEKTLLTYDALKKEMIESHRIELKEYKEELKKELQHSQFNNVNDGLKRINECSEKAYDLVAFVENAKKRILSDIVEEATKKINLESPLEREIVIYEKDKVRKLPEALYHSEFENIMKLANMKIPIMLIGPTGSGKSVCVKQVADALGLNFYYSNNVSEEYKMLGFTDAHGVFKETQFFKAFKDGGLFFLDEMDSSHPTALLSINSAIGSIQDENLYMAFEDGKYTKAHKDFRIVAAANTWGNGANRMYCGRNELDAASLNRFVQIYFNYDPKLERAIIDDYELLKFFWDCRYAIDEIGLKHALTTRNIIYANELINAGFSNEQVLQYTLVQNLNGDDLRLILKKLNDKEIDNNAKFVRTLTKLSIDMI